AQTRVARAEVVDRKPDAQVREEFERARGFLGVCHQRALGDLELDLPGSDIVRLQNPLYGRAEVPVRELPCRQVYRNRLRVYLRGAPLPDLRAHRLDHPLADRHDEPRFLEDRHELAGGHEPALRVPPPQERLDADDGPRGYADLRLVVDQELPAV